ncbi:MAG: T9SS type A sorting domain-containing protein [Bacteroidota bacterium]
MKKLFLLLITFVIPSLSFSQGCLPGGITFTTQEQIDNFQTDYPGCTVIEGDVSIGGTGTDICNLSGLSVVTGIEGDLGIFSTTGLEHLTGLDQLASVGGSVTITGNLLLRDLTGLENINEIPSSLQIHTCPLLISLAGLDNLQRIGNNLSIDENNLLTDVSALSGLDSVARYMNFVNNASLENLDGLDSLSFLGKGLNIENNLSIQNINGIENLSLDSVLAIRITNNPNLSVCNIQSVCELLSDPKGTVTIFKNSAGCDNPAEVAGSCRIPEFCLPYGDYYFFNQADIDNFPVLYPDCNQLTGITIISGSDINNLAGLNQITSVGTLDIGNGIFGEPPMLQNLEGLNNITSVGWHLVLQNLPQLMNLSGLEGIKNVGSGLGIYNNSLLADLSGLAIEQDSGYLNIFGNESLTSLRGLENLTEISEGMEIIANNDLGSLSGLNNVHSINGSVIISDNANLSNLSGLENLEHAGGLNIDNNQNLVNLSSLQSLTSLSGELYISLNEKLQSLTGLNNIDANSISILEIWGNDLLTQCAVESICNYLLNSTGYTHISGNSSGCNSPEEVEAACEEVGVNNIDISEIKIYPNPANDYLFIETAEISGIKQFEIMNVCGRKVLNQADSGNNQPIDIGNLPDGLYILKVTGDNAVEARKFLKK